MRGRLIGAVIGLAAAAIGGAALAQPPARKPSQCFLMRDFRDWRAPDGKTIYIRVHTHDYYRLDLAGACPDLTFPAARLITKTHGTDSVCSAIDWDLSVAQPGPAGFPIRCMVQSMTRLSPAEVDALPPKFRP